MNVLKNTNGLSWFTYFFIIIIIGVTELRSVHVHMLDLRNNGNMILTKRREWLFYKKHLTLNRIICMCFQPLFFYHHFGAVLIPFSKALRLFKIRKKGRKLRFVHSVIRSWHFKDFDLIIKPALSSRKINRIKGFFLGWGVYFCKIAVFILPL